jgi:hypothetical protein
MVVILILIPVTPMPLPGFPYFSWLSSMVGGVDIGDALLGEVVDCRRGDRVERFGAQ